jgi:glutathione S-transferase
LSSDRALPLVCSACKIIYGEDILAVRPVRNYLKRMSVRVIAQMVNADRKISTETLMARISDKAH